MPGLNRTVAPDVLVAPEPDRNDVSITPDPIVMFEILSKSDRAARSRRKLSDYASIASIMHDVVVRQDRRAVTDYRRDSAGRFVDKPPGDVIDLSAIGVTLTVETIHAETVLA